MENSQPPLNQYPPVPASGAPLAPAPAYDPNRPVPLPPRGAASQNRMGAGALGGLLLLLAKFKFLFLLIKVPFAISMVVTIAIYTVIFGFWAAVGIVAMLFIHEMGHVVELRRHGIRASAPMFIPFMGAFIAMRENPRDAVTEAKIGLAGPIAGTLAAVAALWIHQVTGSELMLFLAYFGFFLNLFNLIPVSPLDGGRALSALSIWFNVVGLLIMAALILAGHVNFLLIVIVALGAFSVVGRFRARRENPEYYRAGLKDRLAIGVVYFGLVAFLAVAQAQTLALLPHHQAF